MVYNYIKSLFFICFVSIVVSGKAQTTLYSETFGDCSATSIPTGWVSSGDPDYENSDACGGAFPACTVALSSGETVLAGYDGSGLTETVVTSAFSTVGFTGITVRWNGYRSTGAPAVSVAFSTNGSSFTNVPFTDVTADDNWHVLTPFTLPSGANNQATVYLRFTYTSTGGGLFFGFDDLLIQGSVAPIWYWNGSGAVNLLSSWNDLANGTGTVNPTSFTANDQVFYMVNGASTSLTAPWTIGGNSNVRLYIGDGTAINSVNFNMASGGTLTLNNGAIMQVTNSSTLSLSTATMPAVASLALDIGSTVNYAQTSGTLSMLGINHHNMLITGGADIQQTGNRAVNGLFGLTNGHFRMSGSSLNTFTLAGTISGSGTIKTGNSGLIINGSGNFGTVTFSVGTTNRAVNRLTINRSSAGNVVLGSALTVTAACVITNGIIGLNGNILTLNGAVTFPASAANGGFSGTNNSSVTITGAGAITNNLFMDQANATTRSLSDLIVNRSGQTVTLGNALDVWGSITPTTGTINAGSGNLALRSNSTRKGRVGVIGASGDLTGTNIAVETFAVGGFTGWTTLGAAGISGKTFSDWNDDFAITCSTCPDGSTAGGVTFTSISGYDETAISGDFANAAHYTDIVNVTDPINYGRGYWVYLGNGSTSTSDITIDVVGSINKKALAAIPLTCTGGASAQNGWNLIANPYPSPISFTTMISGNANIVNAYYVWNPDLNGGAGDFAEFAGGVSSPAVGAGGVDDNIPTGQGFYVQVTANTSLNPVETWKSATANTNPLLKTKAATGAQTVFRLNLTGGPANANLETVFHFNTNATNGYDTEYDAYQLPPGDPSTPIIFSFMNNNKYRINGLPALNGTAVIPVGVLSGHSGNYQIAPVEINNLPSGACVSLFDKFTNTTHDLRSGPYAFSFNDTTTVPRFNLIITLNQTTLTASANNPNCIKHNTGQIVALGTTAGPWNYTWKDVNGTVIKTSNNKSTADTLNNLYQGTYKVDINTVGSCDNANDSFVLTANSPLPVSGFTVNHDSLSIYGSTSFIFTNTSTNANSYTWYFGDGATANTVNAGHMYAEAGYYDVFLLAVNAACGDSSVSNYNVKATDLQLSAVNEITKAVDNNINIGRDEQGIFVELNYNQITKATVSVSNILGQTLLSNKMIEGKKERFHFNINSAEQLLLITVSTPETRVTKKLFN